MDMTNKSLALLLVAAIVISLGSTLIGLNKINQGTTGLVPGLVQVGIATNLSCTVVTNVSFGSAGQPNQRENLSTENNNVGYGYNDCSTGTNCIGLQVNNTGNVNINVSYQSTANGTGFLGGINDNEQSFLTWAKNSSGTGTNNTAPGGCTQGMMSGNPWQVNNTGITILCLNLSYQPNRNLVTMEFNVTVDPETPASTKNATITITCLQY